MTEFKRMKNCFVWIEIANSVNKIQGQALMNQYFPKYSYTIASGLRIKAA